MTQNITDTIYYDLTQRLNMSGTAYQRAQDALAETTNVLKQKLGQGDWALLVQLEEQLVSIEDAMSQLYFRIGMALGLSLMRDAQDTLAEMEAMEG